MHHNRNTLLGLPIGCESIESSINMVNDAMSAGGKQLVFACANTHSLVVANSDKIFREALSDADILVADGVGVTLAGKALNLNVGQRIAGEQFFTAVMRALNRSGKSKVFFLGSSDYVLKRIEERLTNEYSGIEFAGSFSPPFRDLTSQENSSIVEMINSSGADLLWVGMTAPKQEKWVYQNRAAMNVKVIGSIGAVFDFFAETRRSPPKFIRKFGLEFLYLLVKNPKRTWKRVFMSSPLFLFFLIKHHVLANKDKRAETRH